MAVSQSDRPVPVPLSNRIRHLLTRQFQGLLFILSLVAVIALWISQPKHVVLVGQVEAVRVIVPASRDGILEATRTPLEPFDSVQKGVTLIASVDVTDALLEMQTLTAEREQLSAELEAQRQSLRQDGLRWNWQTRQERRDVERQAMDRRRIELDQQRARIDRQRAQVVIRDRVDQLTSDVVDLDKQRRDLAVKASENRSQIQETEIAIDSLVKDLERIDRLIELKMSAADQRIKLQQDLRLQEQTLESARSLAELLKRQAEEIQAQLTGTKKRLAEATKQLAQTGADNTTTPPGTTEQTVDEPNSQMSFSSGYRPDDAEAIDEDTILEPYHRAIAVQDAKIRELANRIASNQIIAPTSGTIAEVHRAPGTFVRQGDPIMTIASDQRRWIVAYLRREDRSLIGKDSSVQIRIADGPTFVGTTTVAEFGSHVESVPEQFRRHPDTEQWGVAIKVPVPADVDVAPGQLVELVIR